MESEETCSKGRFAPDWLEKLAGSDLKAMMRFELRDLGFFAGCWSIGRIYKGDKTGLDLVKVFCLKLTEDNLDLVEEPETTTPFEASLFGISHCRLSSALNKSTI